MTQQQYHGVGRRKEAIVRVYIKKGTGEFRINGETPESFFDTEYQLQSFYSPLKVTNHTDKVDIKINAKGGGKSGLSQACIMGIARALVASDSTLEPKLRQHHMLTRDPRVVERKKYGQPGARKKFQFSKR